MKSPSELLVASLLLYPKGDSLATRTAQAFIRYKIKMASEGAISGTVQRLAEVATEEPLLGFVNGDLSLVPVPGHTPRLKGGLWVAEIICQEMVRHGLGLEILSCLVRTEPVPRSSLLTKAEDRPAVADHYRSFPRRKSRLWLLPVRTREP